MALYAAPRIRRARGPFGRRRQRLRMRDEYRAKFSVLGLKIAYYRKRREAIEALSSVLWGYTSKDRLDVLEQFFPEPKSSEKQAGK